MKTSRITVVALIALVGTVALAGISSAHDKSFKSRVSLALTNVPQDDIASGEVDAHKQACRPGRTVVLFEESKPGVTGEFIEIGRTTTDGNGAWSVPIQNGIKKGRAYHAEVKTEKIRNNRDHKHICKPKSSPDVVGT